MSEEGKYGFVTRNKEISWLILTSLTKMWLVSETFSFQLHFVEVVLLNNIPNPFN